MRGAQTLADAPVGVLSGSKHSANASRVQSVFAIPFKLWGSWLSSICQFMGQGWETLLRAIAGGLLAAMHQKWTIKTLLLYASAGFLIMVGFYSLFRFVLNVPLP